MLNKTIQSEAPRSKLQGVSDKTERNSAGVGHPPSSGLRRRHLALPPHSKLWGIRAEASEGSLVPLVDDETHAGETRVKKKTQSPISPPCSLRPESFSSFLSGFLMLTKNTTEGGKFCQGFSQSFGGQQWITKSCFADGWHDTMGDYFDPRDSKEWRFDIFPATTLTFLGAATHSQKQEKPVAIMEKIKARR
jgi:hypothetical protein